MDKVTDFDKIWLRIAYVAATESNDPSTQNGAVLVRANNSLMVTACNRFPRGVNDALPERWERPAKYAWVEHAERNAIYAAARAGEKTEGATLYVPWFACADCARAIIQAGITEVVGHKTIFDMTMDRWKDSIALAHGMLTEAGVSYRMFEGEIGAPAVRFDGGLWHP